MFPPMPAVEECCLLWSGPVKQPESCPQQQLLSNVRRMLHPLTQMQWDGTTGTVCENGCSSCRCDCKRKWKTLELAEPELQL